MNELIYIHIKIKNIKPQGFIMGEMFNISPVFVPNNLVVWDIFKNTRIYNKNYERVLYLINNKLQYVSAKRILSLFADFLCSYLSFAEYVRSINNRL